MENAIMEFPPEEAYWDCPEAYGEFAEDENGELVLIPC